MAAEDIAKLQERFGEAINTGNYDAFDDLVASYAVDHDPGPGQVPGPEGYKALFAEMRTAFPDMAVDVAHMTVTDEEVALAYTVTGTHQGPLMGHPATGRAVSIRGLQIARFADGKMVERWGSSDQLTILRQLGLVEV